MAQPKWHVGFALTCGRRPGKNFLTACSNGRVRSRVRPVSAAGWPLALCSARSGSQSKARTRKCDDPNGFSRSSERPYLHYVILPLPIGVSDRLSHATSSSSGSLYLSPRVMMAQAIRAILLARATAATFDAAEWAPPQHQKPDLPPSESAVGFYLNIGHARQNGQLTRFC